MTPRRCSPHKGRRAAHGDIHLFHLPLYANEGLPSGFPQVERPGLAEPRIAVQAAVPLLAGETPDPRRLHDILARLLNLPEVALGVELEASIDVVSFPADLGRRTSEPSWLRSLHAAQGFAIEPGNIHRAERRASGCLFVTQSLDGVEPRGAPCREVTEDYANCR